MMLGIGCVILLSHTLGLPYNYFKRAQTFEDNNYSENGFLNTMIVHKGNKDALKRHLT